MCQQFLMWTSPIKMGRRLEIRDQGEREEELNKVTLKRKWKEGREKKGLEKK